MLINWRQNAAMGLFAIPLGLRAQQVYDSLPRLAWSVVEGPFPALSIIVPARNESANLRRLLPTLTALEYPGDVQMRMYASDPARSTFESWGTMERADQPGTIYAAGGATTIWVDFKAQKSAPMPDWLRRIVE